MQPAASPPTASAPDVDDRGRHQLADDAGVPRVQGDALEVEVVVAVAAGVEAHGRLVDREAVLLDRGFQVEDVVVGGGHADPS